MITDEAYDKSQKSRDQRALASGKFSRANTEYKDFRVTPSGAVYQIATRLTATGKLVTTGWLRIKGAKAVHIKQMAKDAAARQAREQAAGLAATNDANTMLSSGA